MPIVPPVGTSSEIKARAACRTWWSKSAHEVVTHTPPILAAYAVASGRSAACWRRRERVVGVTESPQASILHQRLGRMLKMDGGYTMQLKRIRPLILAGVIAVFLAASATAQPRASVTLYADVDFRGASETFYGDVASLKETRFGNDRVSSLRVEPGCTVILYSGANFRGQSAQFRRDAFSMRGTDVGNDSVSSLRLRCEWASGGDDLDWSERRGVALYRDAGSGQREIFYGDDSDLRNNRIGAGKASSVRVAPGCRVTLYSEVEYRGRSTEVSSDIRDLSNTRLGNDEAWSLAVSCGGRRDDRWDDRRHDRRDDRRDDGRGDSRTGGGWNPWGQSPGGGSGVTLFTGIEYVGRSETFYGDVANLGRTQIGNDTVSSVRVARGCRLTLFEDADYRGRSSVLTDDVPSLRNFLGNNRASSLRLDCARRGQHDRYDRYDRGVTLYGDRDFRGRSQTFYRDVRDLHDTEIGNDTASSVRVAPGCRAVLYPHRDFRGEPAVLTYDAEDLRNTAVGNDSVSSIEVDCR